MAVNKVVVVLIERTDGNDVACELNLELAKELARK